jgi:diacylglycerol O-acyltransferase / trehalose O-mycolyltransferase
MRTGSRRAVRTALCVALLSAVVLGTGAQADEDALPPEGPVTVVTTHVDRRVDAAADYARLMALPSIDTGTRPVEQAPIFTGADGCPAPRCSDRAVPVPKGVRITSNLVRVLLPTGYDDPRNRDRRYPVVFLWNGLRNDHDSWTYKTELLQMSRDWQAIFVMPAGGKNEQAGMFSDWADGTWDWETYHTKVLVPWVDRTYRTVPGARVSAGASMGGLGALNYATRHPGMFKAVVSISAIADTTSLGVQALDGPEPGWPDLRRVWGDPVLDRANWDAHNPTVQAKELEDVALFITSGTGYASGPGDDAVTSGDSEKNLWDAHRGFLSQLTQYEKPYSARITVGGAHGWVYFDPMVQWAMPKAIEAALC